MSHDELISLQEIVGGKPWEARAKLAAYLKTVTITEEAPEQSDAPKRTLTQNKALWKGFQLVADALTAKGVTMRKVYEKTEHFDVPPTKSSVHDLWIYFQERMYGTASTRELSKLEGQIEGIWNVMLKNLGELFHIDYIDFPHDPEKKKELTSGGYKTGSKPRDDYEDMTEETQADKF